MATLTLTGASGKKYEFEVHELGDQYNDRDINKHFEGKNELAAVYAVTRREEQDDGSYKHVVIYIGHTEDLSTRFSSHNEEECFRKHGANAICVRRVSSEKEREQIEEDLISKYNPPCNEHHTSE